jgi:hypothetical protein
MVKGGRSGVMVRKAPVKASREGSIGSANRNVLSIRMVIHPQPGAFSKRSFIVRHPIITKVGIRII